MRLEARVESPSIAAAITTITAPVPSGSAGAAAERRVTRRPPSISP